MGAAEHVHPGAQVEPVAVPHDDVGQVADLPARPLVEVQDGVGVVLEQAAQRDRIEVVGVSVRDRERR